MSENNHVQTINFVELAADIVAAYVSNNSVPVAEMPILIHGIHAALTGLAGGAAPAAMEAAPEKLTAAQIRKSITPEGIVSFLDGKTYQTLKRHLTGHSLDPHSYRQRFGLPVDYPMVAAGYAARRSELAKSFGLGQVGDRNKDAEVSTKGRKKAA